jgi:hypothetical protein
MEIIFLGVIIGQPLPDQPSKEVPRQPVAVDLKGKERQCLSILFYFEPHDH